MNNAAETTGIFQFTDDAKSHLRNKLSLDGECLIVLLCSSLYPEKRPMVALWKLSTSSSPPVWRSGYLLRGMDHSAISFNTPQAPVRGSLFDRVFGPQRDAILALADLQVLPGAVGLSAVDSLRSGVPLVTAEGVNHGPEFSYLPGTCKTL